MSLCPHIHDTRASLAGTIPNVTILWGSWHWAVSGPIGPNLPVFHYPESRSNPILPSRTERALEKVSILSLFPSLHKEENGEREHENPFVSSRSADQGSMKAERARARERKKMCKWKRKNGNLWTRLSERCPPSWSRLTTGVDQRNFAITLLPSSFLPTYLSIYLSRSLSLFFLLSLSFSPTLSPTCSFCPVSSRFAFLLVFTLSSRTP